MEGAQAQGVPRRKNGIRGTGHRETHLGGHQRNNRALVESNRMDRLGAPGFCNKGWEVYNVRELGSAQTPPPIFFTPQPELTHRRVARN